MIRFDDSDNERSPEERVKLLRKEFMWHFFNKLDDEILESCGDTFYGYDNAAIRKIEKLADTLFKVLKENV